jgi:hypothetical protein
MSTPEPNGIVWQTSSFTAGQGNCVEVGWQTSSYSAGQGNCVEVARTPADVLVRDTKDRSGGTLDVGLPQWLAFVAGLRG